MTRITELMLVVLLGAAVGCASDGSQAAEARDVSSADLPDASPAQLQAWHTLFETPWTLPVGDEEMPTTNFVAARDYTITAIRAIAPLGTHHVGLLGAGVTHNLMFTSPLGTGVFTFPEGIGLRIHKGDAMALDLHLINVTDKALAGMSGLEIQETTSTKVHEANVLTAAKLSLNIPPGKSEANATCTLTYDQTIFAVAPHMHALGVHLKTSIVQASGTKVLYDEDFDFTRQTYLLLDPIQAKAGDQIKVVCTWENTTDRTVMWGGSANNEMCQSMIYRYPEGDGNFCDH